MEFEQKICDSDITKKPWRKNLKDVYSVSRKVFINPFNTNPIIFHCPGTYDKSTWSYWTNVQKQFFETQPKLLDTPNDLTVVTWNNGKEKRLLEKCLEHLGITYTVLGQGIENWQNNIHKFSLTKDFLKTVKTKYVLGLDCFDVLVIDDLTKVLEIYKNSFNCGIVYNADKYPYIKKYRGFEERITRTIYKYLNAGVWIGETEFCKELYEEAQNTEPLEEYPTSEQAIIKELYKKHYPKIQIDSKCQVFRVLHPMLEDEIDIL